MTLDHGVKPPLTTSVELRMFPALDSAFAEAVEASALEVGYESPRSLQAALRATYPRAVVRSNVDLARTHDEVVWYVYRDGSARPAIGNANAARPSPAR